MKRCNHIYKRLTVALESIINVIQDTILEGDIFNCERMCIPNILCRDIWYFKAKIIIFCSQFSWLTIHFNGEIPTIIILHFEEQSQCGFTF